MFVARRWRVVNGFNEAVLIIDVDMRLIPVGTGLLAVVPSLAVLGDFTVLALAQAVLFGLNDGGMDDAGFAGFDIYKPLADSCRLTSDNKVSSNLCLVGMFRKRKRVLWSGTPSFWLRLMKHQNIKSLASCLSISGSLKPYPLCNNKALKISNSDHAASLCFWAWMLDICCSIVFQSVN